MWPNREQKHNVQNPEGIIIVVWYCFWYSNKVRMHLAEQHLLSHVPSQGDLTKQKQNCSVTLLHNMKLSNIYRCLILYSLLIICNSQKRLIVMSGRTNWNLASSFIAQVNFPETVTFNLNRNWLANHPLLVRSHRKIKQIPDWASAWCFWIAKLRFPCPLVWFLLFYYLSPTALCLWLGPHTAAAGPLAPPSEENKQVLISSFW